MVEETEVFRLDSNSTPPNNFDKPEEKEVGQNKDIIQFIFYNI